MTNKTIDKIYTVARKVNYFFNFRSTVKDNIITAYIGMFDRTDALKTAMNLIAQFKGDAEIILNDNNIVIVASDIRG